MQAIYDKRYREKHKEKLSQKQKERYKKEKEQGITKKYDAAKKYKTYWWLAVLLIIVYFAIKVRKWFIPV